MTESAAGIRDLQRQAVRDEIAARAMELFLARGYDETTIDDVAAAVGVSVRTVFRYVSTKEEMALGAMTDQGLEIAARIDAADASDTAWAALASAVEAFAHELESGGEAARARSRLLASTPQLRGALADKHQHWQDDITPAVARRLGGRAADRELRARSMVASALACLDVAAAQWAFDDDDDLVAMLRVALAAPGKT